MKLTIELDREVDGRWIAEVPELNVLLYGDSKRDEKGTSMIRTCQGQTELSLHSEELPEAP
jgi:hypothetical protein